MSDTPPLSLSIRSVSLSDYRRNPVGCLGAAVDGEVLFVGCDSDREDGEVRPLGVLIGFDLWKTLADEVADEPEGDETPLVGDPAEADATRKPVPVTGQAGLWCCYEPDCPGVTDEEGGYCGEHEGKVDGGGIYGEE